MNTQTPQEKDFQVFNSEPKINPFLVKKLKQIADYISEPSENNFFIETSKRMTGELAMQFIFLANVFRYEIVFTAIMSKTTIFFNKI